MARWTIALLLAAMLTPGVIAQDTTKPDEKEDTKPKEETVDELLKRVEEAHKEHKDFKGNFTQTKYLPAFDDKIESSGRFVFKKPDHVRWEYEKPHKSILVITGESGKKWSESTGRTESFKLGDDRGLDAVVKQLFTWFKGEFTKLKDDYDVEVTARNPATLKMTPKKELVKKFIAGIEVKFTDAEKEIKSVRISEPLQAGDEEPAYALYEFTDTRLDSDVKDEEFEIKK
jgi:outer membrane lipoprotein-sorting protein